VVEDDPEERGARIIFRSLMHPRWFADLLWRTWLRLKRRREERARLRRHLGKKKGEAVADRPELVGSPTPFAAHRLPSPPNKR
jgi:hypothetical protein